MTTFTHGSSTYRVTGYIRPNGEPVVMNLSRYQKPYKVKHLFGGYSMSRSNVESGGFWVRQTRISPALMAQAAAALKANVI